jgi:WD40 repeat protein
MIGDGSEISTVREHKEAIMSVCFSTDCKKVISASADKTVIVWTIASDESENQSQLVKTLCLVGHKAGVNAVAISPDGLSAVSGSSDTLLKIWNLVTGKETRSLYGHSDLVLCCAASPCGKFVLSSSQDCTVRLWSWTTGKELKQVRNLSHNPAFPHFGVLTL